MAQTTTHAKLTPDHVAKAYDALASGDMEQIPTLLGEGDGLAVVPGHNPLSGWYNGLDEFLGFMGKVGSAVGGQLQHGHASAVMTSDE